MEAAFNVGRNMLAEESQIRRLLANADEVGAVYRFDGFREALVVTNDLFVADAIGVPQHAFLLACLRDITDPASAGQVPRIDQEVVLLRVSDTVALPDEGGAQ